LKAIFKLNRLI